MLNWNLGKKSDIETQTTFDNSIRGLPFKRREVTKEDFEKLRSHCWTEFEEPSLENVQMVFMTCDTQDSKSVVMVCALDVNDNIYVLDAKEPEFLSLSPEQRAVINSNQDVPVETVEDMLNKEYLVKDGIGIKPTFCIMDRQGHRTNDVQYFADHHPQVMMYQGTHLQTETWKMSDNNKRLIMASARKWQSHLIFYLYSQKKRRQNYLYFYPSMPDNVIKQIVCVKPDNSKKFGSDPENWEPENGAVHDFFDTLKMAYLAVDFAQKTMSRRRWRFCKAPSLLRRWEKQITAQNILQEDVGQVIEVENEKHNWFNND